MGRPAVSQHLKVLKLAGLVTDEAVGTRRMYRIDPEGLQTLEEYVRSFWSVALLRYRGEILRDDADRLQSGSQALQDLAARMVAEGVEHRVAADHHLSPSVIVRLRRLCVLTNLVVSAER